MKPALPIIAASLCPCLWLVAPSFGMEKDPAQPANPCLLQTHPLDEQPLSLHMASAFELTNDEGQRFILAGLLAETLALADLREQKLTVAKAYLTKANTQAHLFTAPKAKPDRYHRTPVFLVARTAGDEKKSPPEADSETLQERFIKQGLARVDPEPLSSACASHLLSLEQAARAAKTGLWKEQPYQVKQANRLHLSAIVSTYQLIEGTVRSVSRRPEKTSYLNFGRNWNKDFTVTLSKKSLSSWEEINNSLDDMDKAHIYVRGWIEDRGGPLIRINHPQQLTIVKDKR